MTDLLGIVILTLMQAIALGVGFWQGYSYRKRQQEKIWRAFVDSCSSKVVDE